MREQALGDPARSKEQRIGDDENVFSVDAGDGVRGVLVVVMEVDFREI